MLRTFVTSENFFEECIVLHLHYATLTYIWDIDDETIYSTSTWNDL